MKNKYGSLKIAVFLLLLFVISQRAKAQYIWTMTHADTVSGHSFYFTALSCSGDNCTAGGIEADGVLNYKTALFEFWRSNDGGITWKMQNPGLANLGAVYGFQITSIQQIDSLNVVATCDSGFLLRTFDAGNTWNIQRCNTGWGLFDVHFSDSLTGIAVSGGPTPIHTTTDGGRHWVDASYQTSDYKDFIQCHSYGNGKFRVFRKPHGPIYSTNDEWKTIDSAIIHIDTVKLTAYECYFFNHCNFTGGDTLIIYGQVFYNCKAGKGLMSRSIDAGKTWSTPPFYLGNIDKFTTMTPLDRDTVITGGLSLTYYYFSTDRGATWIDKPLVINNSKFDAYSPNAIAWASNGHPVAAYQDFDQRGSKSIIIRGDQQRNRVESYENIFWNTFIYPNPASTELNLVIPDGLRPIHIYDMLGREVLHTVTSTEGKVSLDISYLPAGVYSLVLDHYGKMLPVGKFIVIGK